MKLISETLRLQTQRTILLTTQTDLPLHPGKLTHLKTQEQEEKKAIPMTNEENHKTEKIRAWFPSGK